MNAASLPPGPEPMPLRWSTARYLALVESAVIEEGRGLELIGGQVVIAMPQGEMHYFIFYALQRVLAACGAFDRGLVTQPTVVVAEGEVYDPEFAFLRKEAIGRRGLPSANDVLWIIEVSVTSFRTDLGPKRDAYATAGIPCYWVVDATRKGIWSFSNPEGGIYREEVFFPLGEAIALPIIGGTLRTETIFPQD